MERLASKTRVGHPARDDRTDETDSTLIGKLRQGDDRAYERLVRNYSAPLLATARRLLNDEGDAQDCVQETFLSAFLGIDSFEERSSLATWLHRITVNAALQKLRTRQRQPEPSFDGLLPEFDENAVRIEPRWQLPASVEGIVAQRHLCELVLSKIRALPEQDRTVLMLRDIEELDGHEVATMLDISEGAVRTRLHRARSALKKRVESLFERVDK